MPLSSLSGLIIPLLRLDTLADRYFIRANRDIRLEKETGNMSGNIIELPQHFWMRSNGCCL